MSRLAAYLLTAVVLLCPYLCKAGSRFDRAASCCSCCHGGHSGHRSGNPQAPEQQDKDCRGCLCAGAIVDGGCSMRALLAGSDAFAGLYVVAPQQSNERFEPSWVGLAPAVLADHSSGRALRLLIESLVI